MLFLLFQLDRDRYAIAARQVAQVLPPVAVKQIPLAPASVCGAFDFRGVSVPLIDLVQLTWGRPAQPRLSTRIILAHYPDGTGQPRLLGLLAERVTETMTRAASDFKDSGVVVPDAPYLGRIVSDARGIVQWIDVEQLRPTDIRDLLFHSPLDA